MADSRAPRLMKSPPERISDLERALSAHARALRVLKANLEETQAALAYVWSWAAPRLTQVEPPEGLRDLFDEAIAQHALTITDGDRVLRIVP